MTDPVLMSTKDVAQLVRVPADQFRRWARHRGLKAAQRVRIGRSFYALWDVDQVFEAELRRPTVEWGGARNR